MWPCSASSLSLLSASATVNEVLAAAAATEISPLSRIASSNSRSSSETRTGLPSPRVAIPLMSSPNAGKATKEVGREDPPQRRYERDQKHPRKPHRQKHRERGQDPRPRAHLLHVASHKLTPASVRPHTMPHSTPHVRPATHLSLLSRSLCQYRHMVL